MTKSNVGMLLLFAIMVFCDQGEAHSLRSAYCNAQYPIGEPKLNILVQPNGTISGTFGERNIAFTARVNPDGTVDFLRPDGSVAYENVTMADAKLYATYHQPAARGGGVFKPVIPCTMR